MTFCQSALNISETADLLGYLRFGEDGPGETKQPVSTSCLVKTSATMDE